MAISTGAKGATILFTLAGLAMIIGIITLIMQSMSVAEAADRRFEINTERVAELFIKNVNDPKDLSAFKAALLKEVKDSDEFMTNDDPILVDNKPFGAQYLADGSVVGFIDRNGNGEIEFFRGAGGQTQSIPVDAAPDPDTQSWLAELSKGKKLEDLPTLTEEIVFMARVTIDKSNKPMLIISDRFHQSFRKEITDTNSPYYRETEERQRRYYTGHWHPPMFFFFVTPGYYRSWHSVRASSLGGGRWGSGGYGSGK
jgi:hypothetical protein